MLSFLCTTGAKTSVQVAYKSTALYTNAQVARLSANHTTRLIRKLAQDLYATIHTFVCNSHLLISFVHSIPRAYNYNYLYIS